MTAAGKLVIEDQLVEAVKVLRLVLPRGRVHVPQSHGGEKGRRRRHGMAIRDGCCQVEILLSFLSRGSFMRAWMFLFPRVFFSSRFFPLHAAEALLARERRPAHDGQKALRAHLLNQGSRRPVLLGPIAQPRLDLMKRERRKGDKIDR